MSVQVFEGDSAFEAPVAPPALELVRGIGTEPVAHAVETARSLVPGKAFNDAVQAHFAKMNQEYPHFPIAESVPGQQ